MIDAEDQDQAGLGDIEGVKRRGDDHEGGARHAGNPLAGHHQHEQHEGLLLPGERDAVGLRQKLSKKQLIASLIIEDDIAEGKAVFVITTPLLERVVACADAWDCAVLMVQREYCKRLTAKPGTPEYGSLTLFVAHFCDAEHLFDAGASGFYPAPAVASSVVRLRPKPRNADTVADSALLLWLIRAAFAQRRKTLVNSIAGQPDAPARDALDAAVRALGHRSDIRGERLALADFERLAGALHAQGFRTPVR